MCYITDCKPMTTCEHAREYSPCRTHEEKVMAEKVAHMYDHLQDIRSELTAMIDLIDYNQYKYFDLLSAAEREAYIICEQIEALIPTARQALLEAMVVLLRGAIHCCKSELGCVSEWYDKWLEQDEQIAMLEDSCAVEDTSESDSEEFDEEEYESMLTTFKRALETRTQTVIYLPYWMDEEE